jgi:hypothetical protein
MPGSLLLAANGLQPSLGMRLLQHAGKHSTSLLLLTGCVCCLVSRRACLPACCRIPVVTDDGNEEELRAVIAVNVESSPLSPEELLLVSGRVALASSFLCLEGTLTGSLWLPIATSAAGLITAIQLSKRGSA